MKGKAFDDDEGLVCTINLTNSGFDWESQIPPIIGLDQLITKMGKELHPGSWFSYLEVDGEDSKILVYFRDEEYSVDLINCSVTDAWIVFSKLFEAFYQEALEIFNSKFGGANVN